MRRFLQHLADVGELAIVDRCVDPVFELAGVVQRIQAATNQAVMFTNVRGSALPVVSNVFGSRRRIGAVIGAGERGFPGAWDAIVSGRARPPDCPYDARTTVHHGRLSDLPLIRYSEDDGGAYLTGGVILARDPATGVANLSCHRAMCVSDTELRVRLAPGHHLTRYHELAEQRGEPLEAAILIGASPQLFLAAVARLAYEDDELDLAARLAGRALASRRGFSIDADVPTEAEVCIEGRFLPGVRRREGPFGEFMGYYVEAADNAVFDVSDVSWREGAVFHSINCGSGEEVLPLGLLASAAVFERLSRTVGGIVDVVRHPGVNLDVVAVAPAHDGHSTRVLETLMSEPSAKMCVIVDPDVDIYDLTDVLWAVLTRARPDTVVRHDPVRSFEHDPQATWGRIGIDASAPYHERSAAYRRKRTPGADALNLADYLPSAAGSRPG